MTRAHRSAALDGERICEMLAAQPTEAMEKENFRRAAVLVPLFIENGEWCLLLTKRADDLEHHKGQISFPGGAMENGESPEETALRESYEEIGLPKEAVQVVARLDDIWTPARYVVTPVAGLISSLDRVSPNAAEVSRLIHAPLDFFADESHARRQRVYVSGFSRTVYFYDYGADTIWGATAYIIRDLVRRLQLR